MPDVISIVFPAFFAIFLGYLVGKTTRINVAPIVDITLYVGVPALVLISLLGKAIVFVDAAKVWVAALLIMFGCWLAAWLVFNLLRKEHAGLYIPIAMMNTMNLPFPIIFLAWGAEGLVAATLFYIPNVILMYTLGVYAVTGRHWKENVKEVFRQPVVYAAIVGLLLNFLGVKVPELLFGAVNFVAMMGIPLVLIVLGHNLSKVKITSFPTTLLASFMRIGVGLGIGLLAVNILNVTGLFRSVVILDSAMPAAAASTILATKYKNEAELVSSVVFLTTLASLVVIPFLLRMLA
ncbi:MAG: hypothetical protein A2137_05355 [Chloroflexi bacterium RBG_16_58_8]|nr:MAG: hypothetical protein A2137_05355 [Chloroflexi bacterium RBG_16_58_8]